MIVTGYIVSLAIILALVLVACLLARQPLMYRYRSDTKQEINTTLEQRSRRLEGV
jgi:hypothetical protein